MKKTSIGSTFDSWLREEGIHDEVIAGAAKRALVRQIETGMLERGLSKADMARRMKTSRAALERLLDPASDSVNLFHLQKAAEAIGRQWIVKLAQNPSSEPHSGAWPAYTDL